MCENRIEHIALFEVNFGPLPKHREACDIWVGYTMVSIAG